MNSSIDFLVARPPVGVRARNGKYSDENGLMAPANCQHQRPAHQRIGPQVFLAPWTLSWRSCGPFRARFI